MANSKSSKKKKSSPKRLQRQSSNENELEQLRRLEQEMGIQNVGIEEDMPLRASHKIPEGTSLFNTGPPTRNTRSQRRRNQMLYSGNDINNEHNLRNNQLHFPGIPEKAYKTHKEWLQNSPESYYEEMVMGPSTRGTPEYFPYSRRYQIPFKLDESINLDLEKEFSRKAKGVTRRRRKHKRGKSKRKRYRRR